MAIDSKGVEEKVLKVDELEGGDWMQAVLADEEFVRETVEAIKQIESGNYTVVTLDDVRESLHSGKPLF